MKPDELDSLLRQVVMDGPREPSSPECLDIHAILRLLDRPEEVPSEDLQHLANCRYCQRAVALARRDRDILESPWSEQEQAAGVQGAATVPRTFKVRRRPPTWMAITGLAAVIALAVGLSWWAVREQSLLGQITGGSVPSRITRSEQPQGRQYVVKVDLKRAVHLTWLYLDHSRKLQLPEGVTGQAEKHPPGTQSFHVTLAPDEPPGPQWIAAIASDKPFNPLALRDELQEPIQGLPEAAAFGNVVGELERRLRAHRELRFRSHWFVVPADGPP